MGERKRREIKGERRWRKDVCRKGPTNIILGVTEIIGERQRNKRRKKKEWKRGHDSEKKKKFFKDVRGTELEKLWSHN